MMMRRRLPVLLLLAAAALTAQVRKTAVAGAFYPKDAKELAKVVDDFVAAAKPPAIADPVVALVSPHAGYPFSGAVAAYGYALIKGKQYDRVVVISPSHIENFPFAAVYDGDAYATPLGNVPVDKEFCKKIADGKLVQLSSRGHAVWADRGEHALEVQLPFLQRVLGPFKLVPIVMGEQDYAICRKLGRALADAIGNSRTLIVASSDLSHYHPYDTAVKMDHNTLRAIEEWDYLSLSENLPRRIWEACGGGPIIAAMIASERLGPVEARLLKYANSGDVTKTRDSVVGYGSMAFVRPAGPSAAAAPFSLSAAEKDALLKLARQSVESAVRDHKMLDLPALRFDALNQDRGAFVTLRKHGELRGCIGYIAPVKPLATTVRDVAAAAATQDRRFPPVTPAELGQLEYEVSVLSPMRRVLDTEKIQVGQHGLVMMQGDSMGLLLPQVPVEEHWDRKTFLEQTCRKAGLPSDAWRSADTDIFSFTALVFGERK
jgi:AmmeMemoRadiSam system protein B/AmmeMemoRadiSam system protein A